MKIDWLWLVFGAGALYLLSKRRDVVSPDVVSQDVVQDVVVRDQTVVALLPGVESRQTGWIEIGEKEYFAVYDPISNTWFDALTGMQLKQSL